MIEHIPISLCITPGFSIHSALHECYHFTQGGGSWAEENGGADDVAAKFKPGIKFKING